MGKAPTALTSSTLETLTDSLTQLQERYPLSERPDLADLVNYSSTADEPFHRWFRYREGFSPEIAAEWMRDLKEGDLVVDPFCGGGSTLLAANQARMRSIGLDVNPVSSLLAKVKTRIYSNDDLDRFEEISEQIAHLEPEDDAAPKPNLSIIDKVFLPEVLRALLVSRDFIESSLSRLDLDFFRLAWLAILEDVSNVYKEGNGIKYRNRKRTPSGYEEIPIEIWQKSMFPEDKFGHVINSLLEQVQLMIEDIRGRNYGPHEPDVFEGDALALDDYVGEGRASLVFFSPPYANNFNYFKAFKIELWMGGFVTTYKELRDLTKGSLRSHVETSLERPSDKHGWYPEQLDKFIDLIEPENIWSDRIPDSLRGYFYDMTQVIRRCYECLEDDGRISIVVGNSAYGGILIPTDLLLAETLEANGFAVDGLLETRYLNTSPQQKAALEPVNEFLRESVILARKKTSKPITKLSENGHIRYRYVDEVPNFPRNSDSLVYVIKNQGLTDLTHNIHKYPSKFIPHIPRWALTKYANTDQPIVCVDPFMGSGTTLVEAALLGHHALGIDVDPLARLISKVKTTAIDESSLMGCVEEVKSSVSQQDSSSFRPPAENLEHWFTEEAINSLGIIREVIDGWQGNGQLYDFLVVSFSSIIRRASNADNQSLKTYVSGTHEKEPDPAIPLFKETLDDYAHRVLSYSKRRSQRAEITLLDEMDSRQLAAAWQDRGLPAVDLAITSPPYIKSIDYIYNQMAELFWIGDLFGLETREKQNVSKQRYLGTEKVYADDYRDFEGQSGAAQQFVDMVRESNEKHAYIVDRFFRDMKDHFVDMLRIMKGGAHYVVVIGNSTVSGIQIPSHEILKNIGVSSGFELANEFTYEIRNRYMRFPRSGRGGIVDLDRVLTFYKP